MSVLNKMSLYRERMRQRERKKDRHGWAEVRKQNREKASELEPGAAERRLGQACRMPGVGGDAGVQVGPALPGGEQGEPGHVLQLWPDTSGACEDSRRCGEREHGFISPPGA